MMANNILVGGIPTPLKKMKSQIGSSSQLLGKLKHVPNHQPVYVFFIYRDNDDKLLQIGCPIFNQTHILPKMSIWSQQLQFILLAFRTLGTVVSVL